MCSVGVNTEKLTTEYTIGASRRSTGHSVGASRWSIGHTVGASQWSAGHSVGVVGAPLSRLSVQIGEGRKDAISTSCSYAVLGQDRDGVLDCLKLLQLWKSRVALALTMRYCPR
ncbi:unnamed protein product, partial [Rotaria magnacalcarata]